ncbi:Cys-Gln thioester bond-forming surface protein [Streptomyces sp. H27-C3]|uniref:Cys-Gln thioester bond-forming surface protein n=1 Tax=Streptomyces sp. H27-C3 TaxID=3046305 RepID=UPI0024B98CB5|nr:Cys-Gln thioester bond-forming surface protein [Streptomyces sp. H27-C3]MDJ0463633.1 Cys-Gln thioester bond-forming surface protein [Streptomyces sp. H27-C3]
MFSALSVRRRSSARLAAALVATGLVAAGAMVTAGPAAADETPQHQGGAVATLDGLKTYDKAVIRTGGKDQQIPAGLFEMTVDGGGKLKTYCVDIHRATQEQAKYLESSWDQTSLGSNRDAGKIRWILDHSYPQVDDLSALAEKAGVASLTEQTAAAGTQVAIWRYSDHVKVDALDPRAEKLADFLERGARGGSEPRASLTLEPNAVSGKPGEKVGPVKVRTGAGRVTVTPPADAAGADVKVVGKNGKPLTTVVNGSELYFDVPADAADGSTSLTVQATTSVPVGRAFAGATQSQTQILAGSSVSTVSAAATATWAKAGAIPALTARKNCAKSGVDITAANKGDEPYIFELMGSKHTVGAGQSRTVTIPVQEDQAYDFTIEGPGGFEKNFKGVLDCKTSGAVGTGTMDQPENRPSPATAGDTPLGSDVGLDLAETGSSNATPMIAGVAIGFVVIGGAAVFFLRKKQTDFTEE